jgi:hypothetical protein
MDAALPARFPLEMFDSIRDVNLVAIDPRFLERAFKESARRPDKWFSRQILFDLQAVRPEASAGRFSVLRRTRFG